MPNRGQISFLLEKANLNSWKLGKSISPIAKPQNKEVITKKLSENHSERFKLLLNDMEKTIFKCTLSHCPKLQKARAVLGRGMKKQY